MNTTLKKMVSLISASLFCLQIAGAVTYQNSYNALGIIQNQTSLSVDGKTQGATTSYDAFGRATKVTEITQGVTWDTKYSYNDLGETVGIVKSGSNGETYSTTIANHGAVSTTYFDAGIGKGSVLYSKTTTASNGTGSTVLFDVDGTAKQIDQLDKFGNVTESLKKGDAGWATYCHSSGYGDPLVAGSVTGVSVVNGVNYAAVKADTIDMYDGKGPQAADGETIMVAMAAKDVATLTTQLASGQNVSIAIAGNVTTDVNGAKSMTINDGGFSSAVGQTSAQVSATWKSANQSFYNTMMANMAPVWAASAAAGKNNTWSAGWSYLKAMAI
jgi:hypothetical protein